MHSMPDFCGSWRGIKTRVERQTTTSSQVRVRHPWETCSFTSFSASVSTLNQQIFTYFVQRRSFLSSCYHFNLKQAFKVNNLVPMTMHHGRCQLVACPLSSQRSRMLMQKRPLFTCISDVVVVRHTNTQVTVNNASPKTCNLFRNVAAKRFQKWCLMRVLPRPRLPHRAFP